jgi:hypothetical protein
MTFENRALRASKVGKLTVADEKFLAKFTCARIGCGEDFTFRIAYYDYTRKNESDRKFSGQCNHCNKQILLTNYQFKRWGNLIKGGKIEIIETTFDNLFE